MSSVDGRPRPHRALEAAEEPRRKGRRAAPGPAPRHSAADLAALILAALLLTAHGALALASLSVKALTNDELSHLPAGLALVETGEMRLNPQHPPLSKLLAGLAASTLDPALPLESPAYAQGNQWVFGRQTLFGPPGAGPSTATTAGNDLDALLFRGRLPMVGLSVLGGLAVFLWSRARFGPWGGLLSLSLYAFSPTVLAHGRLVTMDTAVTAAGTWALYLWWRTVKSNALQLSPIHEGASPKPGPSTPPGGPSARSGAVSPRQDPPQGTPPLAEDQRRLCLSGRESVSSASARSERAQGTAPQRGRGREADGRTGPRPSKPPLFPSGLPWKHLLPTGLALGLALAAKFNGLVLLPAMVLADLLTAFRKRSAGTHFKAQLLGWLRTRTVAWLVLLGIAVLVIEGAYLIPDDPLRYLKDIATVYPEEGHTPDHPYYWAGTFRTEGFPHYFVAALLVKTSLPGLLAMAAGLALAALRWRRAWREDLFLLVPAAVWLGVTSALALDLGVRYVLLLYPLLFILAGRLAPELIRWGRAGAAAGHRAARLAPAAALALALGQAGEALAVHPDYLPYFHRLAGGARGGIHLLDGSNLDWGQDLARLPGWLADRGVTRPRLLYFGPSPPEAYGVERSPMEPEDWWIAPRPGDYVISAQYLIRGMHLAETGAPGPGGQRPATDWLRRYEPSGVLGGTLYWFRIPAEGAPAEEADQAQQP